MKTIIITLALAFLGLASFAQQKTVQIPYPTKSISNRIATKSWTNQFSIKSEKTNFGYIAVFTNDGWKTKQPIMAYRFNWYHQWILTNKLSADAMAGKYKTYKNCLAFNKAQYALYKKNELDYQVATLKP